MEHLMGLNYNGRLLALASNIRIGMEVMGAANTVPYYIMATITAVESFIVQGHIIKDFLTQRDLISKSFITSKIHV